MGNGCSFDPKRWECERMSVTVNTLVKVKPVWRFVGFFILNFLVLRQLLLMDQESTGPVSELQFAKWGMSAFTLRVRGMGLEFNFSLADLFSLR